MADAQDTDRPTNQVALPHGQGDVNVRPKAKLAKWVEDERDFWATLGPHLAEMPGGLTSPWPQADRALGRIEQLLQRDGAETSLDEVASGLHEFVGILRMTRRDPRAQYLAQLIDADFPPGVISATYAAFAHPSHQYHPRYFQRSGPEIAAGAALAAIQIAGIGPKAARATRDSLRALEQSARDISSSVAGALAQADEARDQLTQRFGSAVGAAEQRLEATLTDLTARVTEVRSRLDTELALQAPASYWTKKADEHEREAKGYRWWFTGVLTAGLVILVLVAAWWLVPTLESLYPAWWPLALFSVLIAVWAWPLRITSKLYLSHRHLHEDASQRAVIAQTFLALSDAVTMGGEERRLLLVALFRDAPVGLVKEDGATGALEYLAAQMSGRG